MSGDETSVRIDGHGLMYEGQPINRRGSNGVGGFGRARCECGELSTELASGAARKRWHRQHKAEVLARRAEQGGQP